MLGVLACLPVEGRGLRGGRARRSAYDFAFDKTYYAVHGIARRVRYSARTPPQLSNALIKLQELRRSREVHRAPRGAPRGARIPRDRRSLLSAIATFLTFPVKMCTIRLRVPSRLPSFYRGRIFSIILNGRAPPNITRPKFG